MSLVAANSNAAGGSATGTGQLAEYVTVTVAELEATRMPTIAEIEALLMGAGFVMVRTEVVERQKAVDFQAVLTELQDRPSYRALTAEECTQSLAAMREEWQRQAGRVVDPRPTLFMVGQKQER